MSDSLQQRVLAVIAKASSQQPARALDVGRQIGAGQVALEGALRGLLATRQIATAQIQRRGDSAPWLAIWPTGVMLTNGAWTGTSHSGLFANPAPGRFPTAPVPSKDARPDLGRASRTKPTLASLPRPLVAAKPVVPKPMATAQPVARRRATPLQDRIRARVKGHDMAHAVPLTDLAAHACCNLAAIRVAVAALVEKGELAYLVTGGGNRRKALAYDAHAQEQAA